MSFRDRGPDADGGVESPSEVLSQLDNILAHPAFRLSRRYPRFLSFVVEQTLAGRSGDLHERFIGVEVFGRKPEYDTDADHVVRTVAGEVRKRLAQYYVEPGRESELRIELRSGTYVPDFKVTGSAHRATAARPASPDGELPRTAVARKRWWHIPAVIATAATVLLALEMATTTVDATGQATLDRFWEPVLASGETVLVCIGEGGSSFGEDAQNGVDFTGMEGSLSPTYGDFMRSRERRVALNDAKALARLAGVIQSRGKRFRIASRAEISLRELQSGPVLLVGGWNNSWTRHLGADLRFSFERTSDGRTMVRDANDPLRMNWVVDFHAPLSEVIRDYAVVSRFLNEGTEQMVVIAAGMGVLGTFAAGELLTDPAQIEKLAAMAPPEWENANLQVVLSTQVVDGFPGPPRVEAVHTW